MKQYAKLKICKSASSTCNIAKSVIRTFAVSRSIPQHPQIIETYSPVIGRRCHQIGVHRVYMNTVDLYISNTPRFLEINNHKIQSNKLQSDRSVCDGTITVCSQDTDSTVPCEACFACEEHELRYKHQCACLVALLVQLMFAQQTLICSWVHSMHKAMAVPS